MNKETARYRRELKKRLNCGGIKQRELLDQFDNSLSCFLEECPSPTYAQLEEAFGPPAEMAAILMESISPGERKRYHAEKALLKVLAGLAAALFVVFALYVFWQKEFVVIETYDTLIPGNITATQEGE